MCDIIPRETNEKAIQKLKGHIKNSSKTQNKAIKGNKRNKKSRMTIRK